MEFKNEKIIRQYDYAKVGSGVKTAAQKTLIITDKRIIHKVKTTRFGGEQVDISDMPVQNAKYVSASYGKKSRPVLLVLAILCPILAIALMASGLSMMALLFGLIFAGVFGVLYCLCKTYCINFSISSDSRITPVMSHGNFSYGIFSRASNKGHLNQKASMVRVRINPEVAKQMAEELGNVIAQVAAGTLEDEE